MKLHQQLAHKIQDHLPQVRKWLQDEALCTQSPFYSSVDLRDSGFKIAPVDNNLYPAGFNNICPTDQRTSSLVFKNQIDQIQKDAGWKSIQKLLIIPENHTSNQFYIENLYYLYSIFEAAGYEVKIGWYADADGEIALTSASGKTLTASPIQVANGVLSIKGFTPDLILLNNDFSSGYPKKLDGVTQPILPSHRMGWHTRRKHEHFVHYNRLASELAKTIDMDPWTMQIETSEIQDVDFENDAFLKRLTHQAEEMLDKIGREYTARKIRRKPFVFVKSNTGTYGMGIMVVRDAKEIISMNRRAKNKMAVGKNNLATESLVIQEGIPTSTLIDKLAAEPVIYLAGCELIGGFLRTHTERGDEENLNSRGMVFRKLCMTDLRQMQSLTHSYEVEIEPEDEDDEEPVLEQAYGMIARLSSLATGLEIKEHSK